MNGHSLKHHILKTPLGIKQATFQNCVLCPVLRLKKSSSQPSLEPNKNPMIRCKLQARKTAWRFCELLSSWEIMEGPEMWWWKLHRNCWCSKLHQLIHQLSLVCTLLILTLRLWKWAKCPKKRTFIWTNFIDFQGLFDVSFREGQCDSTQKTGAGF